MTRNMSNRKMRDPSLTINLTKGGQVSKYGLIFNHSNKDSESFEVCNSEILEKFRTFTAHKIHMEGSVNISNDNPLLPSRITGYNPFLSTAFDISLPD